METDKLLAKLEEQIKNSIDNQSQILEDLREIFRRLEKESKILVVVKANLDNHLDLSKEKKEELDNRFKDIRQTLEKIQRVYENFDESFREFDGEVAERINERRIEIKQECERRKIFETEIKTTLRSVKIFFSILAFVATILSPIVVALLQILFKKIGL